MASSVEGVELSPEAVAAIVDAFHADAPPGEPPALSAASGDEWEDGDSGGFEGEDWHAIKALRSRVGDVLAAPDWQTPNAFHRFIVARKGNLDAAESMYREAMQWRREKGIDSLLWRYSEPEAMRRFFASAVVGADSAGYPVLVERTGSLDLAGLGAAVGPEAFLEWVAWYHERQERVMRTASRVVSEALGRPALRHKMTVIVDLHGIGRAHLNSATLGVLQRRTKLEESRYPEVVRRVFIVRAPAIFSVTWTVVSTFVDAGTRAKMSLSSDASLPAIRDIVPDRFIPAFIGGGFSDDSGDECALTVGIGGTLPEGFRVGPDGEADADAAAAGATVTRRLTLPAGTSARVAWWCPSGDTFRPAAAPADGVELLAIDDGGVGPAALAGGERAVLEPAAAGGAGGAPPPGPAASSGLFLLAASPAPRVVTLSWTSTAWMSEQRILFRAQLGEKAPPGAAP